MNIVTKVENLRLKFTGEQSLLFKDLSCSFSKGEKVLLLGPSGCGKSTLLQVLCGIIPNTIEIPMKADEVQIPKSWGYVFQDPDTQFCMPYVDEEVAFVLENLRTPKRQMQEKITYFLQQVGLNLDDIHTPIQNLSGGMKQRLAIASVLALEPEVLFLDEPTAMLDPNGTKEVWEAIKQTSLNKTLIIVEHKIDQVLEIVDRIILFNEFGEIIADGFPNDIFSKYKQEIKNQGIWYPGIWEETIRKPNKLTEDKKLPIISLRNFNGYRQKQSKISVDYLDVHQGEWIVVKGENGAGKSTFLHSLIQFIQTSGEYYLHGQAVKNSKGLSEQIAFVFQNPELQFITNSVFEEIAFSLRFINRNVEEIHTIVDEILNKFALTNHREKHPYQLSMGQKRRLSVAASIVKGQQIFLLDEPTFGQDAKNTFALLEMLENYRKNNRTIIMITHDEKIVEYYATRLLTIKNGQLIKNELTRNADLVLLEGGTNAFQY